MNWLLFMWHWVLSFQGLSILGKSSATELLPRPLTRRPLMGTISVIRCQLNTGETMLHGSHWHFLHDFQAPSLLPVILFSLPDTQIIMCFDIFSWQVESLLVCLCAYAHAYTLEAATLFLYKFKIKHLAFKGCTSWVMGHSHDLQLQIVANGFLRRLY